MALTTRLLLLALIGMVVLGTMIPMVKAQDDDDDGVPRSEQTSEVPQDPKVDMNEGDADDEPDAVPEEEEEAEEGPTQGLNVKTVFLGKAAEDQFVAGEWVETLVSFSNIEESPYTVRFVAAHLNQPGDANAYVQNFTGNAYDRTVEGKETHTFKYRFQPHVSLDARDYNLVVRVFFSTSDNNTLAIAAHNNTISIQEPSGTDPEMIMTFVTIFGLIGGAVYWFNNKKGGRRAASPTTSSPTVEMGSGSGYNEAYVSPDHLRYMESLEKSKSPSPKRK